jgi:hypothetical protein
MLNAVPVDCVMTGNMTNVAASNIVDIIILEVPVIKLIAGILETRSALCTFSG